MKKLLSIALLVLMSCMCCLPLFSQTVKDRKRALAILGDAHHSVFPLYLSIVKEMEKQGYETDIIMDFNVPFDKFSKYDLIVLSRYAYNDVVLSRDYGFDFSKASENLWLSSSQEQAFEDFVMAGGRLMFHHDGIGYYPKGGPIHRLSKAHYLRHPPINEITVTSIGDHPELTAGIEPFVIIEEEFVVEMDESQTTIFLESHSEENGRTAMGWTHEYGKGRVVVLIPGHNRAVLFHPMFKQCLNNALSWLEK